MRIEGTPSLDATDLKQGISTFKIKNFVIKNLHYDRTYSILSLIIIFLLCLFRVDLGSWIASFRYLGICKQRYLHGPWLPIYGSGSILILILLKKFRKKPFIELFECHACMWCCRIWCIVCIGTYA